MLFFSVLLLLVLVRQTVWHNSLTWCDSLENKKLGCTFSASLLLRICLLRTPHQQHYPSQAIDYKSQVRPAPLQMISSWSNMNLPGRANRGWHFHMDWGSKSVGSTIRLVFGAYLTSQGAFRWSVGSVNRSRNDEQRLYIHMCTLRMIKEACFVT